MGRPTPLRRCSYLLGIWLFAISGLHAADKMPFLHKVGALPVQTEKIDRKEAGVSPLLALYTEIFSAALRDSHRFVLIEEGVVAAHWENPEEREKWVATEEISGFVCLTLTADTDTVHVLLRLLSPDGLDVWLQEMTTWEKTEFFHADASIIEKRLRTSLYALLNRLPLDVTISAIQGNLLTITGGNAQGLAVGDQVDLLRAHIRTRSPATQDWESFTVEKVGRARILEVEETTAVAQLLTVSETGALSIGDGIVRPNMPSRHFFQLAENRIQAPAPLAPPIPAPATPENISNEKGVTAAPAPAKPATSLSQKMEKGVEQVGEAILQTPEHVNQLVKRMVEELTADAGLRLLHFSGPFDSSTKFLWYLPLNTLGISAKRHLYEHFYYAVGLGGGLGSTKEGGSYTGYYGDTRVYWEQAFQTPFHGVERWQVGGIGAVEGLSVRGDTFGGFDEVQCGVFGGLLGHFTYERNTGSTEQGALSPNRETLQIPWFAEFRLTPLTLGRIGYEGTQHTLGSSLGWKVVGGAFWPKIYEINWGASVEYGRQNLADTHSTVTTVGTTAIKILANWKY